MQATNEDGTRIVGLFGNRATHSTNRLLANKKGWNVLSNANKTGKGERGKNKTETKK